MRQASATKNENYTNPLFPYILSHQERGNY